MTFDRGWQVYHRHGPRTLVAVCLRACPRPDGQPAERAVPPLAGDEPGSTSGRLGERAHPVRSSVASGASSVEALLLQQREPVVAQAGLGQRRELVGERHGRGAGRARRHDPLDQADPQGLLGVDRAGR